MRIEANQVRREDYGDCAPDGKNDAKRKVLMIAYVFPPIAYVGTYRTLRFCRYLPENGWIPHVLTIKEGDDLDYDYGLLDRIPKEAEIYRTRTVDFWRMWKKWSKKKKSKRGGIPENSKQNQALRGKQGGEGFLRHLKSFLWDLVTTPDHMVFWIPFAVIKAVRIIRKEECELIYTTSPPHSEHIIGLILSKLFKKPWVADFRDPIMDSSGYNPKSNMRNWVDRHLEKIIVKNADKVIIISENYRRIICERYPDQTNKFVVLPNGFDQEIFENVPAERFDKFTILYAGSFYAKRSPQFFLRSFSRWLATKPAETRDRVQVIFYGLFFDEARAIAEDERLSSVVHFSGLIPQDSLIPKLKGAHLLLLIIGFDEESKGTVTSKIFEYMACNRPILAIVPEGEASKILHSYRKFYWVNQEDDELLIKCLDQAFHDYWEDKDYFVRSTKDNAIRGTNLFDARVQTKMLSDIFLEAVSK